MAPTQKARKKPLVAVMLTVMFATAAFIFWNSLQITSDSWQSSNAVAVLFEPILRRIYNLVVAATTWAGHPLSITYWVFVRKLAHFIEYCLLGAECAAVAYAVAGKAFSPHLWACLFIPLMVAVCDEFVQTFSGRMSQIRDVLLDFSGALAGIVAVLLVASAISAVARSGERG